MTLVNDETLDVVDTLVSNHVLPGALFARLEDRLGHESFRWLGTSVYLSVEYPRISIRSARTRRARTGRAAAINLSLTQRRQRHVAERLRVGPCCRYDSRVHGGRAPWVGGDSHYRSESERVGVQRRGPIALLRNRRCCYVHRHEGGVRRADQLRSRLKRRQSAREDTVYPQQIV